MDSIDAALERRVWQRVYGREPQHRQAQVPLGQLYSTARDCAQLYRSLRLESKGPSVRRFAQMQQQMEHAARQLASLQDGQAFLSESGAGCPGCSRRRRLELLTIWMQEWSRRCREFSGDARCGQTLGELAHMGENHCRMLDRMLGK